MTETARITAAPIALTLLPGVTGGILAVIGTALVYKSEDAFSRLPVHWMWWPAFGGLIIGVGGLFQPRALGVGYDVIGQLLTGRAGLSLIVGILIVKTLIWSLSLGLGTSGGVLAPVFMIGGALGALEGQFLPHVFPGFWAMAGLAAVVGVHLTREYVTDPLEALFARDVAVPALTLPLPPDGIRVYGDQTLREVASAFARTRATSATVVERADPRNVLGLISLAQLMLARERDLHEEEHRERLLTLPFR